MDASMIYPNAWHPMKPNRSYDFKKTVRPACTRTQCAPKYYIIDYGVAVRFNPADKSPTAVPVMSGDRTAPELQGEGQSVPHNPFPTDVYYVENLLRIQFLKV